MRDSSAQTLHSCLQRSGVRLHVQTARCVRGTAAHRIGTYTTHCNATKWCVDLLSGATDGTEQDYTFVWAHSTTTIHSITNRTLSGLIDTSYTADASQLAVTDTERHDALKQCAGKDVSLWMRFRGATAQAFRVLSTRLVIVTHRPTGEVGACVCYFRQVQAERARSSRLRL
jgi:hypothetical protein